jgi:hypothetical protein
MKGIGCCFFVGVAVALLLMKAEKYLI